MKQIAEIWLCMENCDVVKLPRESVSLLEIDGVSALSGEPPQNVGYPDIKIVFRIKYEYMAYLDIINPEHPAAYLTKEAGKIIPRGDRPVSDVPLANKQMIFLDYLKKHYAHSTFLNYL